MKRWSCLQNAVTIMFKTCFRRCIFVPSNVIQMIDNECWSHPAVIDFLNWA